MTIENERNTDRDNVGAKLHQTMDAWIWADEFNGVLVAKGEQPYDPEWLFGWFANAIMCGWDHAHWKIEKDRDKTTPKPTGWSISECSHDWRDSYSEDGMVAVDQICAKCQKLHSVFIRDWKIEKMERLNEVLVKDRDDSRRLADAWKTLAMVYREALKKISQDGCGCHPICRCDSVPSLLILKEEVQGLAKEALALPLPDETRPGEAKKEGNLET